MSLIRASGLCVNPDNLPDLRAEMDRHGEGYDAYFGKNENGEEILALITHDRLELQTYQGNGWRRVNVYRREGGRSVAYDSYATAV